MFTNYLKTDWRNLWRNKVFSVIKIPGLALGIACSLLIMLWVNDEQNIDAFHKNSSQLSSIFERRYNENSDSEPCEIVTNRTKLRVVSHELRTCS